ncbi:hypothetical protein TCE0_050r18243 [Talaromyces pinophilus]|jgi:hypothetical protein|uniref:Uncharacterized protein n=1 Tax=Talaromyces pinophilus TaxID=128442 RepID=A0A0B8N7B1_TALPI|nr:hypothetical protein TCE0_050r18243 [Talaromyces pinophilus]
MTTTTDPLAILADLLNSIQEYTLDSLHDFQDYIGQPKVRHWLRIIVIVAGYIMLRPVIELFFKWWFERKTSKEEEEQKKKKEEEDKQLEAEGLKKPKKDGNSLRVGAKSDVEEEGKKKDEVVKAKASGKKAAASSSETNKKESKVKTDEYENSDQEDFAEKIRASGVLEWGRDARKRKQRQTTEAEQQQQQKNIDEEKLLELLDWSDDEGKQ